MKLTKCENSHFYDSDKYPECPYCNTSLQQGNSIVSAATGNSAGAAVQTAQPSGPVTGWLVVMSGKAQGLDLRLGEGRNFIGADADGAPVLLSADSPLSARQGVVVYDPATSVFTLLPGTSKELCYLAGEAVLMPQTLSADDELTLSGAVLRFVPFCGEFKWETPEVVPEKTEDEPAAKPAAKTKSARTSAARTAAAKREAAKTKSKRAAKSATTAEPETPATVQQKPEQQPESKSDATEDKKQTAAEK